MNEWEEEKGKRGNGIEREEEKNEKEVINGCELCCIILGIEWNFDKEMRLCFSFPSTIHIKPENVERETMCVSFFPRVSLIRS